MLVASIFSFSHYVYKNRLFQGYLKSALFAQPFTIQSRLLMTHRKTPFEKIVGKGENSVKQHLSFSHNVFYSIKGSNFSFYHSVFYPFRKLSAIYVEFEIVFCKVCLFRIVSKIVVWEMVKG